MVERKFIPEGKENKIVFKQGLYGFENITEYFLEPVGDDYSVVLLKPLNTKVPSFVLIDPFQAVESYTPVLSDSNLGDLGADKNDDLLFYVIAVVQEDHTQTVVNLKSPIVINPKNLTAFQVILENCDYPVRYRLFDNKG